MPVRIEWDNPQQTILHVCYEGQWTWKEFYDAAKDCAALASTVPHRVYIIAEMSGGFLPPGAPFVHSEKVMKQGNGNMGFVVVVSSNRFINGLMSVSSRIVPKWGEKYCTATTIEQARALIEQDQQKIVV